MLQDIPLLPWFRCWKYAIFSKSWCHDMQEWFVTHARAFIITNSSFFGWTSNMWTIERRLILWFIFFNPARSTIN
jgi:hypothetical protein